MKTAMITFKIDPKVKEKAQKTASNLGLSLSSLINCFLVNFVRTKAIHFEAENNEPSDYLIEAIKDARERRKNGDFVSFDNLKDKYKRFAGILNNESDKGIKDAVRKNRKISARKINKV